MLRATLRFAGIWVLAAALIAAVVDGSKSIAASALVVTPLVDTWTAFAPQSIGGVERVLASEAGQPWLWAFVQSWVLGAPTALALGVLGFLLIVAGRRSRRPGYHREYA